VVAQEQLVVIDYGGGNIGSLAVHGTVNDLAVSGAVPETVPTVAVMVVDPAALPVASPPASTTVATVRVRALPGSCRCASNAIAACSCGLDGRLDGD